MKTTICLPDRGEEQLLTLIYNFKEDDIPFWDEKIGIVFQDFKLPVVL
jgi:ABC-type ATPase involved in cell division